MRRERIQLLRSELRVLDTTDPSREMVIEERKQDGEATIRFLLAEGLAGIAIPLSENVRMDIFRGGENADGHLLVSHPDGGWTAHVVECKKAIKHLETWQKTQRQLRAGMVRLQMVADFLGIPVAQWQGHVAFREERISLSTSPNMATLDLPIGGPKVTQGQQEREAWEQGQCPNAPFGGSLAVHKIQLDAQGCATVPLGSTV